MMLVFHTREHGTEGNAVALLMLRRCKSGETPLNNVEVKDIIDAIRDITGGIEGFMDVTMFQKGDRELRYDQRYDMIATAFMERGKGPKANEIRSRVIVRTDKDLLAENEPISQSLAAFYAARKPWKYYETYLVPRGINRTAGPHLRRRGPYRGAFKLAKEGSFSS